MKFITSGRIDPSGPDCDTLIFTEAALLAPSCSAQPGAGLSCQSTGFRLSNHSNQTGAETAETLEQTEHDNDRKHPSVLIQPVRVSVCVSRFVFHASPLLLCLFQLLPDKNTRRTAADDSHLSPTHGLSGRTHRFFHPLTQRVGQFVTQTGCCRCKESTFVPCTNLRSHVRRSSSLLMSQVSLLAGNAFVSCFILFFLFVSSQWKLKKQLL